MLGGESAQRNGLESTGGEQGCRTRTIRIRKEEVMCRSRKVTNIPIKNKVF